MDYGLEEPADQEEETGPEEIDSDGTETEPDQEDVADQEEDPAEGQPEEGTDETVRDPEEEPEEEPAGEEGDPGQETVSGNDLVVSGDVIVLPEEYDFSTLGGEPADTESIVQAVEKQSDIMTAGFTCTCFMLGVLAGALVIAGFRLRRV
ncbi:MAG: hypothetical protein K2K90_04120 [Lachnospiraceae bacterium]|nr:hypothetical protein [Lachnospiraceae bacterium]